MSRLEPMSRLPRSKVMNFMYELMCGGVGERTQILGIDTQIQEKTKAFREQLNHLKNDLLQARGNVNG